MSPSRTVRGQPPGTTRVALTSRRAPLGGVEKNDPGSALRCDDRWWYGVAGFHASESGKSRQTHSSSDLVVTPDSRADSPTVSLSLRSALIHLRSSLPVGDEIASIGISLPATPRFRSTSRAHAKTVA